MGEKSRKCERNLEFRVSVTGVSVSDVSDVSAADAGGRPVVGTFSNIRWIMFRNLCIRTYLLTIEMSRHIFLGCDEHTSNTRYVPNLIYSNIQICVICVLCPHRNDFRKCNDEFLGWFLFLNAIEIRILDMSSCKMYWFFTWDKYYVLRLWESGAGSIDVPQ